MNGLLRSSLRIVDDVTTEMVDAAIDNGVVLIGLPSHTTHLLQPLDVKVNIWWYITGKIYFFLDYKDINMLIMFCIQMH